MYSILIQIYSHNDNNNNNNDNISSRQRVLPEISARNLNKDHEICESLNLFIQQQFTLIMIQAFSPPHCRSQKLMTSRACDLTNRTEILNQNLIMETIALLPYSYA